MHLKASVSLRSKAGNTAKEIEDAYHYDICQTNVISSYRFAVADGSTEGLLSGRWARILSLQYCRCPGASFDFDNYLRRAQLAWHNWLGGYVNRRTIIGRPLQWFEELGLQRGTYSTLLGVTYDSRTDQATGIWNAVAVGDSCLFHIRDEKLLISFPISSSIDFEKRPFLISSMSDNNETISSNIRITSGEYIKGDIFYLMTDALACWFLKMAETGNSPWEILRNFDSAHKNRSFKKWITYLRAEKLLRNDDVTVMTIKVI